MDELPISSDVRSTWTPKRAAGATLIVVAIAGSVLLLSWFYHVFILLFLAIILAIAIEPVVAALNRQGMRWSFAVGVVYIVFGIAIFGAALFGGPMLVDEAGELLAEVPANYERFHGSLASSSHNVIRQIGQLLPNDFASLVRSTPANVETSPSQEDKPDLRPIVDLTRLAFQGILGLVIVVILSAYWLVQEQRTFQSLLLLVQHERREHVRSLIGTMREKVGAYIRGQFVLCLVVGLMSFVGYWFIGLPQSLLLAVIAGVLEAVPMIGPLLGAVPALAVALTTDPTQAVGVVILVTAIQLLENYLLVPHVMDRAVGINGLVTLLAIAAFGTLFGVTGAILAIPLAAILQVLADRYLIGNQALEPAPVVGRDRVSKVRYELQSLIKDVRMVIRQKPHAVEDGNDTLEEAIEALAVEVDRNLACPDVGITESEGIESCTVTSP